jgi:hypothetical protein
VKNRKSAEPDGELLARIDRIEDVLVGGLMLAGGVLAQSAPEYLVSTMDESIKRTAVGPNFDPVLASKVTVVH